MIDWGYLSFIVVVVTIGATITGACWADAWQEAQKAKYRAERPTARTLKEEALDA